MRTWRGVLACGLVMVAALASAEALPGTGEDGGKTVLYRDTWGVAHIYADTVEGGLYAMGWAQAEDRPEALLKNLLRALGESARFEGPDGLQADTVSQLWDLYGTAKAGADRIQPEVRRHVQAFARGVNDWYKSHPEDVPVWWGDRKVDEFMIVAFGRLFLYSWSIDDAFSDLERGGIEPGFDPPQRGSNQWSVSPQRSAEGVAMLYIDPHLSWWGPSRFWEFRIHAGNLHGSGVTLAGFPYVGLGHNANIAWAMTTGGPDTADIYALTLNPENPLQYRYDDAWRDMTVRKVTVEVKGVGPKELTLYHAHLGPIVAMRGGKAYAAAMAYADAVEVNEAWHKLNFAKDYRGAVAAMDTLQLFPQNVMVADTSGNIYYQRTGRVPRRPEGYDWSRPVDGSTSATAWQGFHPASDHVQILNPPQGYMQNCNIPPDGMMVDSPLTPDKYPHYLYNTSGGYLNPRGARAVSLLSQDESVTVEEALAYAVDVHPFGAERWVGVLREAHAKFGERLADNVDYAKGITDILGWDLEVRRDSTGALKYAYWREQLVADHGRDTMAAAESAIDGKRLRVLGKPEPMPALTDAQLTGALGSFVNALTRLKADFGSIDATYGDKYRVGRDEHSWPVGGGDDALTTLRNMSWEREREDHTRWGRGGQTSTQLVVLSKPIRSWMYLPVGESDRPDSPHYRDQAEKVFSPRKLKETWWLPEDLAGHIESRTVLPNAG